MHLFSRFFLTPGLKLEVSQRLESINNIFYTLELECTLVLSALLKLHCSSKKRHLFYLLKYFNGT